MPIAPARHSRAPEQKGWACRAAPPRAPGRRDGLSHEPTRCPETCVHLALHTAQRVRCRPCVLRFVPHQYASSRPAPAACATRAAQHAATAARAGLRTPDAAGTGALTVDAQGLVDREEAQVSDHGVMPAQHSHGLGSPGRMHVRARGCRRGSSAPSPCRLYPAAPSSRIQPIRWPKTLRGVVPPPEHPCAPPHPPRPPSHPPARPLTATTRWNANRAILSRVP